MRRLCLLAALLTGAAVAQPPAPPAETPPKLPDLNAKEWKPLGGDGIKVWDVKEGKGTAAALDSTVLVHYTGWLTDGNVFDSSVTRHAAIAFPLNKLIKGWQEGIPGMKPGGVRRLVIPPALAYGDKNKPGIPPGSTLVFEIELFDDPLKMPDPEAKEWQPGPQGLKIWDVRAGTGAEVKAGDTVTIHYTGWTTNGQIFDSSRRGGEPATFGLGRLISGWQVGMPGMKEGGIRRLMIPSALGYGAEGRPPQIPGGATLIFDIEVQKTTR